jgi:hypothetical protein
LKPSSLPPRVPFSSSVQRQQKSKPPQQQQYQRFLLTKPDAKHSKYRWSLFFSLKTCNPGDWRKSGCAPIVIF